MTKRRWLLLTFAATVPFLLIFALPPSIALALQTPGELIVKETLLCDGAAVVVHVLVSWLSLALPAWVLAYMMTSKKRLAQVVALVGLVGLGVGLLIIGRSQTQKTFVGTFEFGFGESNFYPNGDCWRPAYWISGVPLTPQIASLGPVTVTFIGDASPIGSYGNHGMYLRQVNVTKLLDVRPAEPCLN